MSKPTRQPEAWETSAAGAFLTIGQVGVWALGGERFLVAGQGVEEEIDGFGEARAQARALAKQGGDA
jgi:hypothetical protein